jgi:hypothetical protein
VSIPSYVDGGLLETPLFFFGFESESPTALTSHQAMTGSVVLYKCLNAKSTCYVHARAVLAKPNCEPRSIAAHQLASGLGPYIGNARHWQTTCQSTPSSSQISDSLDDDREKS